MFVPSEPIVDILDILGVCPNLCHTEEKRLRAVIYAVEFMPKQISSKFTRIYRKLPW